MTEYIRLYYANRVKAPKSLPPKIQLLNVRKAKLLQTLQFLQMNKLGLKAKKGEAIFLNANPAARHLLPKVLVNQSWSFKEG